ncbi:MAG: hypothetical protein R2844_17150 [Caldilineales bacterium]
MRKLPVLGLLLALSLVLLACQAPAAPVDTGLSNVEATIEQAPAEAPTATTAPTEPTAVSTDAGQTPVRATRARATRPPAAIQPPKNRTR